MGRTWWRERGIYPLGWLPNQDGFTFVGIRRDQTEVECRVVRGADGQRRVNGADFNDLVGWRNSDA